MHKLVIQWENVCAVLKLYIYRANVCFGYYIVLIYKALLF